MLTLGQLVKEILFRGEDLAAELMNTEYKFLHDKSLNKRLKNVWGKATLQKGVFASGQRSRGNEGIRDHSQQSIGLWQARNKGLSLGCSQVWRIAIELEGKGASLLFQSRPDT